MQRLPVAYLELEAVYARSIGQGMRTLAVCAANSGEGVSMLAEALAHRTQAAGRRVLLVEMNLYQPTMANHFGIERQAWLPALSEKGQGSLPLIHETQGFGVLPASLAKEASMRLREPHVLEQSLNEWLSHYDHVIFDTSPLNATNQHNIPAERIAAACEGCLLLVLAGKTTQSAVIQARRRLDAANVRLIGAVVNDCYNPTLAAAMERECKRLDRWAPRIAGWLKRRVMDSPLLNVPV